MSSCRENGVVLRLGGRSALRLKMIVKLFGTLAIDVRAPPKIREPDSFRYMSFVCRLLKRGLPEGLFQNVKPMSSQ